MNQNRNKSLPRLLVIGAKGFLGGFVVRQSAGVYDVVRADKTSNGHTETDVIIDVADSASVKAGIDAVRPDAVILLAAISDIDRCQREPQQAFAVNLYGAEHVANACARMGAKLLFTSTGAVFDGLKTGYRENDAVSPVSVYGETKAQAEFAVQQLVPDAIVLRVSLITDLAGRTGTNSLLDNLRRRWESGEAVSASTQEFRNPIDAATLSTWMIELLTDENAHGVYHAGCQEAVTRYELASFFAYRLGVSSRLVVPEREPPANRAPRGRHHWLLTEKINRTCTTQAPGCAEVIERSLNEVAQGSLRAGV